MTGRKSSAAAPIVIALLVLLLPGLYLLSIGPAYRHYSNGKLDWETYEAIYSPVLTAAGQWPAFASVLNAYGDWWAQ